AFAIEPQGPAEPDPEQRTLIDRLCREIVKRRLTTPALAFLEMSRPLNYMSSQLLHFLAPLISAVSNAQGHRRLADFLEHRGSIDFICDRIAALETEADAEPRSDAHSLSHVSCENHDAQPGS
ncbi:MAG: hypothetical protein ABGZ17_30010, partial [Planctomycetaceae bacterium]